MRLIVIEQVDDQVIEVMKKLHDMRPELPIRMLDASFIADKSSPNVDESGLNEIVHNSIFTPPLRTLLIPCKDKLIPLEVMEIAFLMSNDESFVIHTLDGRKYELDRSLDSIAKVLPRGEFIRANRQFIVARKAIESLTIWFGGRLQVDLKVAAPEKILVSKAKSSTFRRWLTSM